MGAIYQYIFKVQKFDNEIKCSKFDMIINASSDSNAIGKANYVLEQKNLLKFAKGTRYELTGEFKKKEV